MSNPEFCTTWPLDDALAVREPAPCAGIRDHWWDGRGSSRFNQFASEITACHASTA